MNDKQIQIQNLPAPCITPADIEALIAHETYFTAGDGFAGAMSMSPEFMMDQPEGSRVIQPPEQLDLLTVCVLITRNGHTVTGESHCADPAKFDAETGRVEARKRAIDKLYPMVIYAERERLAREVAPKVTDEMVGRFLAWKLPQDFAPDCHTSFNRQAALASQPANWPFGTNLLHAGQVRDMLNHVIGSADQQAA